METDPTDPTVDAAPQTKSRWRPKWPSWLTPPVVISSLAFLLSAANAYVALLDKRDEVQAFWSVGPLVGYHGGNLQMLGSFDITIFNVGNRSAVIRNVQAFLTTKECDDRSAANGLFSTTSSQVIKPGEAHTIGGRIQPQSNQYSLFEAIRVDDGKEWLLRPSAKASSSVPLKVCLVFNLVTPSGSHEKTITKATLPPLSDQKAQFAHTGGAPKSVTLYQYRWPFGG